MNEKDVKYHELFVPVDIEQINRETFERVLGFVPLILEHATPARLDLVFSDKADQKGVRGVSFANSDGKLDVLVQAGDTSRQYVIDAYNTTIHLKKADQEMEQLDIKGPTAQSTLADIETALIAGESAIVRSTTAHDQA